MLDPLSFQLEDYDVSIEDALCNLFQIQPNTEKDYYCRLLVQEVREHAKNLSDKEVYDKIYELWRIQNCTRKNLLKFLKNTNGYTLSLRLVSPKTKRKLIKKGISVWWDKNLWSYVRNHILCEKLGGK